MYFENNTCNPFHGPFSTNQPEINATWDLAVNVSDAATAIAGAHENNVRLINKNTGQDVLGCSTGQALWTHNLKNISFFHAKYTGPAVRVGAGVQV